MITLQEIKADKMSSFGDNGIDSLFQPVYQLDGAASAQAW